MEDGRRSSESWKGKLKAPGLWATKVGFSREATNANVEFKPSATSLVDLPIQYEAHIKRFSICAQSADAPPHLEINSVTSSHQCSPHSSSITEEETRRDYRRTLFKDIFHVWDNRLALKLFGGRRAVILEKERQEKCPHLVIHPCSKFRIVWDTLMLLILGVHFLFVPVSIAFFHQTVNPAWIAFSCFSDLAFICDIFLNFRTGFITNQTVVVLDLKQIRLMYLKKWFAIDIISILPFDYIVLAVVESHSRDILATYQRALGILRLVKLLSLVRLLRVLRFMRYMSRWEELFMSTKSFARIVKLMLCMLLLAHWDGCIEFLIPYLQGFPPDSWVSVNKLENAPAVTQYSWALFKALSHMLCIGYGRWPPHNEVEVWLTTISMLIGASFYATFIGHISTLVYSADSASRQYTEKLQQVGEYMRYRKLPQSMKQNVHDYYYQRYHGQLFDEDSIMNELSPALREEIVKYNCRDLVRLVPFFANAEEAFISATIQRLRFDVFLPGDYIIHFGAMGRRMYFIQHGIVDLITSNGKVAASLSEGSFFGEICLLTNCRRMASVRAVTVCDLYWLSKEDFDVVLEEFPHIRVILERIADERISVISKLIEENSSDEVPISKQRLKFASPAVLHSPVYASHSADEVCFARPEDIV